MGYCAYSAQTPPSWMHSKHLKHSWLVMVLRASWTESADEVSSWAMARAKESMALHIPIPIADERRALRP